MKAVEGAFRPIRNVRVTDEVALRLEERILDGTFADGDMLPSEKQLAEQLGVGRRSIREALRVLEMKGLVEVQMGVGTLVRRNDLDSFLGMLFYLLFERATLHGQRQGDGYLIFIYQDLTHHAQVNNIPPQLGVNDLCQRVLDLFYGWHGLFICFDRPKSDLCLSSVSTERLIL